MDFNGVPNQGLPFTGVPVGFGMNLAMNKDAMLGYANLTESQKEEILMRCRDASSKEEMQKIVDSLVPDADVRA